MSDTTLGNSKSNNGSNKKGPPIKTVSITQARKPIYKTSVNLHEKYKNYLEIFNKIDDLK